VRSLTVGDQGLLAPKVSPPPSITSTAAVWWAGDLTLADGDPVGTWTDRVGSRGITSSGSARPTYRASSIGSRPAVDFDGSNDVLRFAAADPVSAALSGCVVAVVSMDAPTVNGAIWSSVDEGTGLLSYLVGVTQLTGGRLRIIQANNGAGADDVRGATVLSTGAQVLEWSSTGTAYGLRVNNTGESLTVTGGGNTGDWFGDTSLRDSFALGALHVGTTPANFFDGRIAYLGVFDAELSSGDRAALYGWISSQYGIAVA